MSLESGASRNPNNRGESAGSLTKNAMSSLSWLNLIDQQVARTRLYPPRLRYAYGMFSSHGIDIAIDQRTGDAESVVFMDQHRGGEPRGRFAFVIEHSQPVQLVRFNSDKGIWMRRPASSGDLASGYCMLDEAREFVSSRRKKWHGEYPDREGVFAALAR